MQAHIEILDAPFDPEKALAEFRTRCGDIGAIVNFTGIVRAQDDVDALILSHYPGFTEAEITKIANRAQARWSLDALTIIHRVGTLLPKQPIVFVAAASAHRREAFEAADFVMDFLKSEAPFWKQEQRGDFKHWIEPRARDMTDKHRWSQ